MQDAIDERTSAEGLMKTEQHEAELEERITSLKHKLLTMVCECVCVRACVRACCVRACVRACACVCACVSTVSECVCACV